MKQSLRPEHIEPHVISRGDDGSVVYQCVLSLDDLDRGLSIVHRVADAMRTSPRSDPAHYAQISIRSWQVELTMVAAQGGLTSSQQDLVALLRAPAQ